MRAMGGKAGAHVVEEIIDVDGIILVMGGKEKVEETT